MPDSARPAPAAADTGAIAALLRPARLLLWCGALCSAAAAAAGLVPYIAVARVGRLALAPGPMPPDGTWLWVAVAVGGGLARLLLTGAASQCGHYADSTVQHAIRSRVIGHLGSVPLGWFTANGTAQLKKTMIDDVEEMHHLIAHALGDFAGGLAVTLTGFGYLLTVDWRIALVSVAVIPFFVLTFRLSMRSSGPRTAKLAAASRRINSATIDHLDGIQVFKTFRSDGGSERRFTEAVDDYAETLRAWFADATRTSAATRILMAGPTTLALIVGVGTALLADGGLSPADLLPFLLVGLGLPKPFMPIVQGGQQLRRARAAARHVQEVLAVAPLPAHAAGEGEHPADSRVEFEGVTFSYDGVRDAVSEFSAVCRPGTVTALVGPSGSGKSTLARLLPRFHDPSAGAIRIGGVDVRDMSADVLLGQLALVFQDIVLLQDTVTENIRIGRPGASDAEVRAAARAAHVHHVIERLPQGYDGAGAAGLSGGEQQRVTIARALLQDAAVVVLDEATAAIDPENEAAVQQALSELMTGRTVLVIAHRLHTVTGADQILVLDQGQLREAGTHRELLRLGGRYARMWQAQHPRSAPPLPHAAPAPDAAGTLKEDLRP